MLRSSNADFQRRNVIFMISVGSNPFLIQYTGSTIVGDMVCTTVTIIDDVVSFLLNFMLTVCKYNKQCKKYSRVY